MKKLLSVVYSKPNKPTLSPAQLIGLHTSSIHVYVMSLSAALDRLFCVWETETKGCADFASPFFDSWIIQD